MVFTCKGNAMHLCQYAFVGRCTHGVQLLRPVFDSTISIFILKAYVAMSSGGFILRFHRQLRSIGLGLEYEIETFVVVGQVPSGCGAVVFVVLRFA